jgi:hypothetical protein
MAAHTCRSRRQYWAPCCAAPTEAQHLDKCVQ